MAGESAPGRNAGLSAAEQMIEAHGGAALWNPLASLRADYREFGGLVFPTRRLVHPRKADRQPRRYPGPYLDRRGGCRHDPRQPVNVSARRVQEPKRYGQAAMWRPDHAI